MRKKIHIYSDKILRCMCEYISTLDYEEQLKASVHAAFHSAVKNGTVEFIMEMIKACPHVIICTDENSRTLFMSSIANRQEKVVSLIYGLEASRSGFVSLIDSSGNTMLHLAAKLSPPSQLSRISGAALQMQRELQWYKEVESIINPTDKDFPNVKGQIARELFTSDHEDLLVKGEEWMKATVTSCTVVGALIITIMFTAAFTVPGGHVQANGYPFFKDRESFIVFIVSDAISLFSSSTSVLMFLGILTSRYAEEDFLRSLPTKLIIGLSTLFFSIATMMVTFCAALMIIVDGKMQMIIPIVLVACIPVTFFMMLQFPLLVEIFVSTYGPRIFNKKMKRSIFPAKDDRDTLANLQSVETHGVNSINLGITCFSDACLALR
uniref:PGG domain-containing protein n=1 Tax=Salix viminalis TaxID=40686 RepID=A0A6N2LRU9_SALVM